MESGVERIRKEIAKRYDALCKERGVPRHNKLYLNLIEPVATGNNSSAGGADPEQPQVVSVSIIFRGNYKLYFNDRIKDQDFELLCEVMTDFSDLLTHLDFSYNEISDKTTKALAKVLEGAIKLESLNLQYNYLGPNGCKHVLDSLTFAREEEEGNSSLVYLNLEGNDILSDGLLGIHPDQKLLFKQKTNIEQFLANNRDLLELNLNNNKIDESCDIHVVIFGDLALRLVSQSDEYGMIETISQFNSDSNSTSLAVLSLDNPYFSGPNQTTAFHIGRMLQSKFCTLEKLSLRKYNLTDEGLSMICEHLITKDDTKLRVLDIGANKITFKGCLALANLLKRGAKCKLESLIMNNNRTGYFGARAMAEAIEAGGDNKESRCYLVHLDMTTNDITDEGLQLIAKSLRHNTTLVSVKLYYNHFGDKSKKEFYSLLEKQDPRRKSDWFLDFTIYKVDEQIQIAYVDNPLPYDIHVNKKYFVNADLQ